MPPIVRLVPALRVLPVPVFDKVMDFFGVNVSMDSFVGRPGAGTREVKSGKTANAMMEERA